MKKIVKKGLLAEMGFTKGDGTINWFPGHMAAATRAIRDRLKVSDLVIGVRDARIPLSSANEDLQPMLAGKRRVIALNKKDLANPNIMQASFIVLDMKPLKKMELPYKRDQQIVSCYSLMEKREDKAEKAASIGG